MQYQFIEGENTSHVVVFDPVNVETYNADSNHPNWDLIAGAILDYEGGLAEAEEVYELFDVGQSIASNMLSDRVEYRNGEILFDGEPQTGPLARHLMRCVEAGANPSDYRGVVLFWERLADNPSHRSREQLLNWLTHHDFSITDAGDIVAYRSVVVKDGEYHSAHSGRAYVDGEFVEGQIPNRIGSVVTMPRSEVSDDPNVACHSGLHCATYDYGSGFTGGPVLEVHVNPSDVVSVPSDSGVAKMRTCRFKVVREVTREHKLPIVNDQSYSYEDVGY